MATITDFDAWLDMADAEGHEEVYSLYRAVSDIDEMGMYECSENNGKYFLKASHVDDTLMLASEKARQAFLGEISSRFGISDFGGDIEGWYSYCHAMSKDD
ncbi:hypothetical protein I6Y99_004995 [Vibrio parahaemolyticus]|uniref:hypothetical protein n=1 Tax=Vibrio parahaemolyticus TaxID=670 RepID=UPI00084B2E6E|nr:hypothetical protein [Vibrio parahaemolyticus]EGQ7810926.1 hypothetical protein [Vibrio parahaemolyticus]EGQ8536378.1 hypothetical protein [Vibrio parahaemolyticus]EHD0108206.1 hypothetical protein [Vibrio parahaemolyticus]EIT7142029.1 hypothetical protein [Vibrio parahaemolyticus]EIV8651581.1 hypothetical protein [Vibrio parahaemolyticus]